LSGQITLGSSSDTNAKTGNHLTVFLLRGLNTKWKQVIAVDITGASARRNDIQCIFLTVAIGNCMVKLVPPVNFCSDQNIQTIFGTKLEDFLNYRIDYNSIS
jgi:hypothetical protein